MSTVSDPTSLPPVIWDTQIASLPESADTPWLLPGLIARGNMTMLTSMWKAGKTTLLAHLLSRRVTGQPLLGLPVTPGKTVVVSEEPRCLWAERCRRFNFGGNLCLIPQPFPHLPSAEQWRGLLQHITRLQAEHGIDLLVIDSLTHFLRAENAARGVLDLLMPVRELTNHGIAALFMHHPRRRDAGAGNAGRGHGALHAEVDISIEMRHAGNNLDSRARRFFCLSRHAATPRHLLFELNADGSDYTILPEAEEGFSEQWDVLRMVLEDAPQKLTRLDILDEWPEDYPKPSPTTLWNWLQSAVIAKLVTVEGTGRKADPFRYWLASTEARWREDFLYVHLEQQARDLKLPFVSLREKKRRDANQPNFDSFADE
jgi:AAA domain